MKLEFNKEETSMLIQEYYKRLEDRAVNVSIVSKKAYTGWMDEQACVTTFTISESIEFMGLKKELTEEIRIELINTIFSALFDLYDLKIVSISINDGLDSHLEGYGMNEHQVLSPYFKGITVNVEKKKNYSLEKRI